MGVREGFSLASVQKIQEMLECFPHRRIQGDSGFRSSRGRTIIVISHITRWAHDSVHSSRRLASVSKSHTFKSAKSRISSETAYAESGKSHLLYV